MVYMTLPGLVNCFGPRDFWISWSGGVIIVGRGHMPGFELARYRDPEPLGITNIELESSTSETVGGAIWEFKETSGKHVNDKALP